MKLALFARKDTATPGKIKSPRLSSIPLTELNAGGPDDPVIERWGITEYQAMLADDEVMSNLYTILTRSLPDIGWVAADDTKEAARNRDFIEAINKRMEGSALETYQAILLAALVSGFTISEPDLTIVELPDFGKAVGLRSIDPRPAQSFTEASPTGIETDDQGRILLFRQGPTWGGHEARPDEVIYYAHRGDANNRWGISALKPGRTPYRFKQQVYKQYSTFLATNASGIRVAKMSDEAYRKKEDRTDAFTAMKRMATKAAMVVPTSWELDIQIPPSSAGAHFKLALDHANDRIRTALLGDSAYSSQTGTQGSKASREVSQENVQDRFASLGQGFCESITEQLNTWLLELNGFSGPAPDMVPRAILSTAEKRNAAYGILGQLRKDGIITVQLPKTTQIEIIKDILAPVGIEIEGEAPPEEQPKPEEQTPPPPPPLGSPQTPVPPPATPRPGEPAPSQEPQAAPPEVTPAPAKAVHRHGPAIRGTANAGRVRIAKKDGAALDELIERRTEELGKTWEAIAPAVTEAIAGPIFEKRPGGGWKTTNLTEIWSAIEGKVTYKSSEIRKVLTAALEEAVESGRQAATDSLPFKAAVPGRIRKGWDPAHARQALANRIKIIIQERYAALASAIYYQIENAVAGELAPQAAITAIDAIIAGCDFGPERAGTILNTACATAWNAARMGIYSEFEDAAGTGLTDIIGYEILSVMDKDTTEGCQRLNGMVFHADDPNLPQHPLHYNCRGQSSPIYGTERDQVTFIDYAESAALIAELKAEGWIQEGFGGV